MPAASISTSTLRLASSTAAKIPLERSSSFVEDGECGGVRRPRAMAQALQAVTKTAPQRCGIPAAASALLAFTSLRMCLRPDAMAQEDEDVEDIFTPAALGQDVPDAAASSTKPKCKLIYHCRICGGEGRLGIGVHKSCTTNLLCERLPAKMPSIDLDLETHQCVPLLSVLQWNPLLTRLFTQKLKSYSPIINSTILVLIDDSMDSGALTAIAHRASTAVRAIMASLDGVRTTGIASWTESDRTINIRPFVHESTHYNPKEYEREETRFEALVLNMSGGNMHTFIAALEHEIVDPSAANSSNINRGGGTGASADAGCIGTLYSNKRKNGDKRKRKAPSCGHSRDKHPNSPCGAKPAKTCTKPDK
uniref:Uncharacterized protein n=1 Tax=Haptolina brevifila TaxID=156173 RepID=A0A7S2HY38_9EUKA|mmetsp:Transcript_58912/g.117054  ORF Transcript_58912/g.117054 Transcript_58912/m.117054 type:complete len:364 (+) Transcript_58912:220-1311(+)